MARKVEQIRNIALIAHVGSGKTSLGEAMLFNAKATTRMGRVDDGSSNFDFEPEEIKRKITISSAIHHCNWKKHFINIIDTPGDDNFLSETKLALQGADGVVLVIDATAGVKVGTEKVWEFAEELKLPKIIFVSKMDRERADYFKVVQEVIDTFQAKATPVFIPLGAEDKFQGLIDLVKMKACVYEKDGSGNFQVSDVPADFSEDAEEWREKMIENIVEVDDELMEKYLEGEELSQQELEDALYKAIKSQIIIPVTCGASVLNIGTSQLMDLIVNGMPSPAERGPKEGLKPGTDEVVKRFPKED
jgi:elongation factor G